MMVSIFSASAAQVYAAAELSSYFTVTHTELVNDKITYTIAVNPEQQKLVGLSLKVKYDGDILAIDSCKINEKFGGISATGADVNEEDTYSIIWTHATGINVASSKIAFAEVTFKVIGEARDVAEVAFLCEEFDTDDGKDNDHYKPDGQILFAHDSFLTLSAPVVNKVYSTISELVVEWGAVTGAESYNVYRKTKSSDWVKIAEGVEDTRYIDGTIATETEYFYNVSAVNANGDETELYGEGVEGFNFGSIDSITTKVLADGVSLTWEKLSLAEKYNVYRKKVSAAEWELIGTSTVNSYTDKTLESYVDYNYRVEAIKGTYVAGLSVDYPVVKYLAIPEFAVTNTENGIEVYYGDVNGASKYTIWKKTGNGAWTVLTTVTNPDEDVYVDDAVTVNGSYTYKIQAEAADGMKSAEKTLAAITRLGTPTVNSISVDVPGMTITWTAVSGATEYKIYRKVYGTNQLSLIGTAVGTSYTDTTAQSNVVYTYTVSAANSTGCGMYDKVGKTRIFFASPVLQSRENVVNGVKITWSPVEGATGYRIYRRGAGTNYWHYLGTIDAKNTSYVDYGKDVNGKNIGMANGAYYRYTVRATNENRGSNVKYPGGYNQTIYSGFDTTGLYLKHVSTPKMVSVTNASTGVLVKWQAISGATSYRVYRRGAGSTYWYFLGEVKGTSYTDTAIANASGKYYRYTVRAVSGYYSGFDTTGLYLMRISEPDLTSARSYSTGLTVKWKQCAGVQGYYVYRKTSNSSWVRIATVKGASNTTYTDKTAKKGTTYIYTVKAYYGSAMSTCDQGGISCRAKY